MVTCASNTSTYDCVRTNYLNHASRDLSQSKKIIIQVYSGFEMLIDLVENYFVLLLLLIEPLGKNNTAKKIISSLLSSKTGKKEKEYSQQHIGKTTQDQVCFLSMRSSFF